MQLKNDTRLIIDLHTDPRLYTIDNFLSQAECAHVIARGRAAGMDRATVSGDDEGVVSDARTNTVAWMEHYADAPLRKIAERISSLVGLPLHYAEKFQIIHYGEGAEYRPHFDAFDPETSSGKRNWEGGGQRLITALCYLNTPKKGGATVFPKLNLSVPAEQGKLIVFHNCTPGTTKRHPLSLHGGAPVEAGDKWAFNLWFRMGPRRPEKS